MAEQAPVGTWQCNDVMPHREHTVSCEGRPYLCPGVSAEQEYTPAEASGHTVGFKVARAFQFPLSAIVVANEPGAGEPDKMRPGMRPPEPTPDQRAAEAQHAALASYVLNGREEFGYSDAPDSSLLAEDDWGYLCGPSDREGWWVDFDPENPRHVAAAEKSREAGLVVLVERGAGEDA